MFSSPCYLQKYTPSALLEANNLLSFGYPKFEKMKKALLVSEASVYKNNNGKLIARGGGEMCFHNIAKSLLKIGIEPTVLAIREFKDQAEEEVIEGVLYKRVGVSSKTSLKMLKYLKIAVKESKNYDYVFLNQFTPHLILPWIKCKKIGVIHDVYKVLGRSFWFKQYGLFKGLIGTVVENFQLYFDKKYADKIMTVSDFSEEKILSMLGDRVARKIVKNPYPIKLFVVDGDIKKGDFILFVGRFIGYKNPEHVLYVLKKIKTVYPNFKAVFVIPRFEKKVLMKFKAYIKELGLNGMDIIYEYNCDDDDLKNLFLNAKLFVQPSLIEGQGIVALEALVTKTPVVAYDLPAYKGMLINGENSILVKKGDKEALAEACLKVLKSYKYYQDNCYSVLKNFSEEKFLERLKEIMN